MKKILILILLFPLLTTSQENKGILLNMSELVINPGQNDQFMEGVKMYKKCYEENGGTETWNIWKRLQGHGNVYVLTSSMANWAEMEKEDEPGKECQNIVKESIWPTIAGSEYNIARSMPDISRTPMEGTKVVWVTFFDVKNSTDFNDIVKEVSSTYKNAKGEPLGIWYDFAGGGPNSPAFMVVSPYKSFAEMDKPMDAPWKVYEDANGKVKTEEMRNKFRNSINDSWSYLYSLKEDLSRSENQQEK